jgi:hypothetical protein
VINPALVEHLRPEAAIQKRANVLEEHAVFVFADGPADFSCVNGRNDRRDKYTDRSGNVWLG